MKLRRLGGLIAPAAALVALATVPLTSSGSKPVLGITEAPLAASITPVANPPATTDTDRVVAFNDIHGYLQANTAGTLYGTTAGGIRQLTRSLELLESGATTTNGSPNVSVVGAGDLVGASPLVSAGFDDEPTLDIVRALGLDYTSVGNHEFDNGLAELKRQQDGGCGLTSSQTASTSAVKQQCTFTYSDSVSSQAAGHYAGLGSANSSDSPSQAYDDVGVTTGYLAANVVPNPGQPGTTEPASASNPADWGKPIFPAYGIKTFPNGTRVGYIGETLAGTPGIVTAAGTAGLAFLDEATVANYYAQQLQAQGVKTIVLLIHQGGAQESVQGQTTGVDSCTGFTGDLSPILANLSSAISVVVSAHTHQAYDCAVAEPSGTKLVTSAAKYSQALTQFDLTIDPSTDSLVSAHAQNVTVATSALTYEGTTTAAEDDCTPVSDNVTSPTSAPGVNDPLYFHVRNVECAATTEAAPLANQVEGDITSSITRSDEGPSGAYDGYGETQMGDVVADAQLFYSQGANPNVVAAFMNEGGVRNDLPYTPPNNTAQPGQVTYGEDQAVQPFGDVLTTMQLTGSQILTVLEEQFQKCNPAQYSDEYLPLSGMTYTVNFNAPSCATLITDARIGVPVGSDNTTAGQPLNPASTYTIEANNYLAGGGDNFPGFEAGQNQTAGDVDLDALNTYLNQTLKPGASPLVPPTPDRVSVIGSLGSFNPQPTAGLPEAPLAVGLPLAFVAIGGGFFLLRRRKHHKAQPIDG